MEVKFVAVTEPGIFNNGKRLTAEELITYMARVSNPENQLNTGTSDKLIRYLLDHKHFSPFDMVNLTVEVETSKVVAIQILRHWSIHPQEFSQRYAEVTKVEPIEFRLKAGNNRQGSDGTSLGTVSHMANGSTPSLLEYNRKSFFTTFNTKDAEISKWLLKVAKNLGETMALYDEGLTLKVAPECARMILPMASTTTMYLNGTIRSWIHYLQQRTSEHAQKEHKLVALEIEKIFKQYFPNVAKALDI